MKVSAGRPNISAKLWKSTCESFVVVSYSAYTSCWKPGTSAGHVLGPRLEPSLM